MLSAEHRMTASDDFAATIHCGVKKHMPTSTVYVRLISAVHPEKAGLMKVGFVVSKKVGNSVVRHRVVRQLRHIAREVVLCKQGCTVVIRAHPQAACAPFSILRYDVEKGFTLAYKKALQQIGGAHEK